MTRQCDPRSFWWRIVYVVLMSVLPLMNLYVLKLLIDCVTHGGNPIVVAGFSCSLVLLLVLFTLLFLVNRLLSILSGVNNDVLSQRMVDHISGQMQQQAVNLDLAYFDNPEYHDTYHRAQQESSFRPLQVLNQVMGMVGSVITIVGIVAMLATASWLVIVVMIVAVVPSFVVRLVKSRRIYAFRRDSTRHYRRTSYYTALLGSREYAKEMRTFGLAHYFRSRYVEQRRMLVDMLLHISRRIAGYDAICAVVETVALFAVTFFLVNSTATGAITIGSFVMLFEAFRRGQSQLTSLVTSISGLYDNRLFLSNLFEFLRLKPHIVSADDPLPFPKKVKQVEFRDVTFRYPDMQRDVLSHYNLTARAGEVTCIEGENGFGKSTLLKLLLRLYDTCEGQVLVDGVDVRRYDLQQLRRGIGAIFQDYVRFFCTAGENICFGDIEQVDEGRMRQSAQMAGADSIIERLPQGYDTQLGRMFDGGEELSMGQWQRIALARQLYSNAPVLVFDEPMAWMDVASRGRFGETLDELCRQGKVIILIKHV